jgi:general secretion pathway protein K
MFLAYVVSAVVLLSAIAVSFLNVGATSYQLARNNVEAARLEAVIDAAIVRAVLGILDPRAERRWPVDGTPRDFTFESQRMQIAIQDELGRIDLNQADHALIAALFRSLGLSINEATDLADEVIDWRTTGPRTTSVPVETETGAAGLPYLPRKGPFQSVDELRLLKGMTPDLYRRAKPALTVYSGHPFPDPQFAPAQVLGALPGQTRETAAAVRAAHGIHATTIPLGVALGGRAFSIRVEIAQPEGTLTREVAIRLTDDPSRPYWLLSRAGQ